MSPRALVSDSLRRVDDVAGGSVRAILAVACLVLGLPHDFVDLTRLAAARVSDAVRVTWRRRPS